LSLDGVEGLELRYFALDALPEPLFAPDISILEAVQARFGKRWQNGQRILEVEPDVSGNAAKR
jgi:hypothetical protein